MQRSGIFRAAREQARPKADKKVGREKNLDQLFF
jgi:hypothetical protein